MRKSCLILITVFSILSLSGTANSTADGPDHWRVTGVAQTDSLNIRTKPNSKSKIVGTIPYNARCIQWSECWGGNVFDDCAATLPEHCSPLSKMKTRWCKISFNGIAGWVSAKYLEVEDRICSRD